MLDSVAIPYIPTLAKDNLQQQVNNAAGLLPSIVKCANPGSQLRR